MKLTQAQIDDFRRRPGTFSEMVQAIYDAGAASVKESLPPAWHDAPTVPGLWINSSSDSIRRIDQHDIDHLMKTPPRAWRWYGPIPVDDGDKP